MRTGEDLRRLRGKTHMNRKLFCEYFKIPYRTVQDWELSNRQMPDYLYDLIEYKLIKEGMVQPDRGSHDDFE